MAVPGDPWAAVSSRHAARMSVDKVRDLLAIPTGDGREGVFVMRARWPAGQCT